MNREGGHDMREKLRFFFYGYGNSDKERRYNLIMRLIWLIVLVRFVHVSYGLVMCLIHWDASGLLLIFPFVIAGGLLALVSTQLD